jgi:hypothetical protein
LARAEFIGGLKELLVQANYVPLGAEDARHMGSFSKSI